MEGERYGSQLWVMSFLPFAKKLLWASLQVSVVVGARSESQHGIVSKGIPGEPWKKVLLVHKSRTVENNLIAFQVDYVFTRNLFSWVFCLDKNGKIIIRRGLWEISHTKWDETKLSKASKCCLCCHSSPRNDFRVPNHLFLSHLISPMWLNPSLVYLPGKDSHLRLYNLVHALAILNFS